MLPWFVRRLDPVRVGAGSRRMVCVVGKAQLSTGMELWSMGYVTVMFFAPHLYHSPAMFLTHIRFLSFCFP